MALIRGNIGIAFEHQPTEGVLAPGLAAILADPTGIGATISDAEGAVLGDVSAGVGESGIDFQLDRRATERPVVTGSLTRQFDDFLTAGVASFTFAWPGRGNGAVLTGAPPVDSEFEFTTGFGIDSLYRSVGFLGANDPVGVGFQYAPTPAQFISALVWDGDPALADSEVFAFIDLLANYETVLTPSESGVQTNTFTGKLDRPNTGAYGAVFPTFDYGDQAIASAPIVETVGNLYDVAGANPRGWSDLTITIDNAIDTPLDSNRVDGVRIEQTTREFTVAMTLDQDSADQDFDYQQLIRETTPSGTDGQMTFQVGVTGVNGARATAYAWALAGLNPQDFQLAQPARSRSTTLTAFATSAVADIEALLTFL